MEFSQVVIRRIAELGQRPIDLVRSTGYSIQYICDLLSRRRRWNETTIDKISQALGIEIIYRCGAIREQGDEVPKFRSQYGP